MQKIVLAIALSASTFGLMGCAPMSQNEATGTVLGAAGGAVVGGALSRSAGGAVVGGLAGGVIGNAVGRSMDY